MNDIELFENWFKSTKWFTGDNCTPKYKTYRSMLQAWQASASREGYKLVPLEPSEDMIMAGCMEHGGYDVIDSKLIYKSMIEAA